MTTATDLDYLQRLTTLFLSAQRDKRSRRENWLRNYRLVNNRIGAPQSAQWQPTPRSSEVYPICSNLVAWSNDHDIVIDIVPAADPHSDFYKYNSKIANDLSATLYSTWQQNNFSGQIKLSDWDALMYGTAILKSGWDNTLEDGHGNAVLHRLDPYFFYPDPHATSLDDAEYLIEARMMTLSEIERRWPDSVLEVEALGAADDTDLDTRPTGPSNDGSRIPLNPGGNTGTFRWQYGGERRSTGLNTTLRYPVHEYWIRENKPYYDDKDVKHIDSEWKVTVTCRNVILMEEWASDIFPFTTHPYDRYCFDDIGEFWGVSLVDHMAQPQINLNRLLTALQMNAELTGNPIFVEGANSGLSRTSIPSRPGSRLTVNQNAFATNSQPQWMQPPAMPPQVLDIVNFWIQRMENLSGMSAMTKGQNPPTQRTAQGTTQSIQEAAFVRVRAFQRNKERALESSSRKLADLIISNYDSPRVISIAGPNATIKDKTLSLTPRHFLTPSPDGAEPLKYSLLIQAGASAPTSRQARIAEADKLYALGAIDDQALLEAHQYPNIDDLLKRKAEKMAAGVHQPPLHRQATNRPA